ncbi:MAG: hypothetical protein MUC56_02335 [Thermoanaerobaculales bacterium]|nr:hypothetical protein [Thermoanaerobaculales bacterium]
MRGLRLLLLIVYASYLTNVGLFLIMLPWSEVWPRFVLLLPPAIGIVVDAPALRGAVTAFGCLHLALLLLEILRPSLTDVDGPDEPVR